MPHRIGVHVGRKPFRTHQCTRQLPPLRRQPWIKLTHSLKCFLLEKKATGKGMLGWGGRPLRSFLLFLLTYRHQGTENPRFSAQSACAENRDAAQEGGSRAGRKRGWPHQLTKYEEQASNMAVFWPFKDRAVGSARCHFSRVCSWRMIWNNGQQWTGRRAPKGQTSA